MLSISPPISPLQALMATIPFNGDDGYGAGSSNVFISVGGGDNDDMLKITGKFSGSYDKKKKEIAVTVDKTASAITLKDFTATTFNINNTNYKISGSKLVKK